MQQPTQKNPAKIATIQKLRGPLKPNKHTVEFQEISVKAPGERAMKEARAVLAMAKIQKH